MITSPQNPLVKQLRLLHERKGRQQSGQFLIEGEKLLGEWLACGYPIDHLLYTDRYRSEIPPAAQTLEVNDAVMAKVATTDSPPPILAVGRMASIKQQSQSTGVKVLAERLQDPGNMGTLFRLAEAAGVEEILLSPGTVDPFSPKVIRSAMGSLFRLPVRQLSDSHATIQELRSAGYRIIAADMSGEGLYESNLQPPFLLLIGQEGQGLSPDVARLADQTVRIPMMGQVESLNAAVAAAVILFESLRQRL